MNAPAYLPGAIRYKLCISGSLNQPQRNRRCSGAALEAFESIVVPVDRAEQVALFDPESGQWHFMPRDTIKLIH
ncbi:hypothetical protein [Burkholderia metallica]|uniref:hypothetical protein n=1 Tax=Burkholderia metallica TaxID=488729 RepID=UPI001576ADE6|nr:hypothetical protein [Burkholderia metallica]